MAAGKYVSDVHGNDTLNVRCNLHIRADHFTGYSIVVLENGKAARLSDSRTVKAY